MGKLRHECAWMNFYHTERDKTIYITMLRTDLHHRRRGYATMLLRGLRESYPDLPLVLCAIPFDQCPFNEKQLIAFYKKIGFVECVYEGAESLVWLPPGAHYTAGGWKYVLAKHDIYPWNNSV